MKKIIGSLLLYSLISVSGISQTLENAKIKCYYELKYIQDTLKPSKIKNDLLILQIGEEISKFYSYNTFKSDSVLNVMEASGMSVAQAMANKDKMGKRGLGYTIFQNYPKGKLTVTEAIINDYYKYTEPYEKQKWKIETETKELLGYKCQRATCEFSGRHYEAWFTTELPVNSGPWKFSGLPGLILSIYDLKKHYQFECVGVEKVKVSEPITMDKKNYINLSKRDFQKIEKKFNEDPVSFISTSTGITITPKNETKSPQNRGFNPIER